MSNIIFLFLSIHFEIVKLRYFLEMSVEFFIPNISKEITGKFELKSQYKTKIGKQEEQIAHNIVNSRSNLINDIKLKIILQTKLGSTI